MLLKEQGGGTCIHKMGQTSALGVSIIASSTENKQVPLTFIMFARVQLGEHVLQWGREPIGTRFEKCCKRFGFYGVNNTTKG